MGGRADSSTYAAAIQKVKSVKNAPELLEHLNEIVNGPAFRGSQRSQTFLKYIVEHAMRGDSDGLRERAIGIELFGRPAAYDTGEDAVVRVAASDVRKRLLQHYGSAGAAAPYRIEIPSGSYVPEFRAVTAAAATAEAPVEVPVAAVPEQKVAGRLQWRSIAMAAALLLAGVAAGFGISRLAGRVSAPTDLFSSMFQGNPRTMQVIVSDEALVLGQVLLGRTCTLQEYEAQTCPNEPALLQQDNMKKLFGLLGKRQISNIGDLQNAANIQSNLRARNWDVAIRHARQVHARDFRTGDFIILGGSYSNPWAGRFQYANSNFPLEETHAPGKPHSYLNLQPLTGEPSRFELKNDAATGSITTFARIALVDNVSRNGQVLLVAGQSVSATEMSAGFLFHRDSAAKVRRILSLSGSEPLPNLEMMLRVTEVNQVGNNVELVACRKLENKTD
jgi:hypothetical protein